MVNLQSIQKKLAIMRINNKILNLGQFYLRFQGQVKHIATLPVDNDMILRFLLVGIS